MPNLGEYFPGDLELLCKDGKKVPLSAVKGKYVFLYFSASWCPPCRGFTPQLAAFYAAKKEEKDFEVIWISWDEEKEDYESYFEKMPWLAVPFENNEVTQALTKSLSVESIPTLICVDADTGKIITKSARARLPQDPEGKDFPWAS